MVIILYFPISRLMMDDGTGLVINMVSHQSWHTPHCKTRRGSGGSSEFSGTRRWSASECLVIGGGGRGGGGKRRIEKEEEEEDYQLGPSQSRGQLSWVSDTKTGD